MVLYFQVTYHTNELNLKTEVPAVIFFLYVIGKWSDKPEPKRNLVLDL